MDQPLPSRSALRRHALLRPLHWALLALSLALTLSAWWYARELAVERAAARFDRQVDQLVALVTERVDRYGGALRAGVAAIRARRDGDIDTEGWRAFVDGLDLARRYPGIGGIGIIHRVPPETRAAFLDRERERRPHYRVHPEPADPDGVLWPVLHIEPEASNAGVIGLDAGREARRREALERARRLGEAQISAPIELVQDALYAPAFLFLMPTREVAFDGMVFAPVMVRRLMDGVLAAERRQVLTSISDAGEIIHDEHDPEAPGHDPTPLFSRSVEVPLHGRLWRFDVRSNLAFRKGAALHQPTLVLIGGLALDLMLLGLFLALARSNRALARVAEMSVDLERKAEALAESNRDLERFACVVSHDLKTPLRGIGDLAWYLEEDLAPYLARPDTPPEIAYNLGRLDVQVRRMNALIEGILDYSAAGSGPARVEQIDTRAVFEEIAETLGLDAGRLSLPDDLPLIVTSRTCFEQVMSNLVGNAFKYHHRPDAATVRVRVAPLADRYRFSIVDDGPGIDSRFHQKVFEMFQTLAPANAEGSTGVGLAIVKKCVERGGGTIAIDSAPGRGTAFHVTWPRTPRDADTPERTRHRPRRAA